MPHFAYLANLSKLISVIKIRLYAVFFFSAHNPEVVGSGSVLAAPTSVTGSKTTVSISGNVCCKRVLLPTCLAPEMTTTGKFSVSFFSCFVIIRCLYITGNIIAVSLKIK